MPIIEDYLEFGHDTSSSKMLGEFCILATELGRLCEQGAAVPMSTSHSLHCDGKDTGSKGNSKRMACEVFLGGSCNPTTWRLEIAIPTLQSLGITYYNPQVSQWSPELIAQEYEAKQSARVLLFVIDNQTRNTAGMIEAAQLAATRSDSLVLVIYPYRPGQTILGEPISTEEYCDLTNGLLVLQYLMERQGVPIFENVSAALTCTSKIIRENISIQDLHPEDGIRPNRISVSQQIDLVKLREIFKSLDANDTETVKLDDALVALQSNGKCNLSVSDLCNNVNKSDMYGLQIENFLTSGNSAEQRISFEQFCIMAGDWMRLVKNNGVNCESEKHSVWSLLFQDTSKFLHKIFVKPFNRFIDWTNATVADTDKRDLYIGVTNKDLAWLELSAMPLIESMGLSLYCPNTNDYNVRNLPQELQRMKNSRLILLIVPQHSRGITTMAIAAHLIGLRAKLVLCVQTLPNGCKVSCEKLTEQATNDYNRGRMYLSDYATREGVPVFQNIAEALQHAIQIVQSPR